MFWIRLCCSKSNRFCLSRRTWHAVGRWWKYPKILHTMPNSLKAPPPPVCAAWTGLLHRALSCSWCYLWQWQDSCLWFPILCTLHSVAHQHFHQWALCPKLWFPTQISLYSIPHQCDELLSHTLRLSVTSSLGKQSFCALLYNGGMHCSEKCVLCLVSGILAQMFESFHWNPGFLVSTYFLTKRRGEDRANVARGTWAFGVVCNSMAP